MSDSLQPHGLQHARLPCPSPSPRACSNSCSSSWWCHPTISSSVVPVSFNLSQYQSFPMSQFFASGSQSIGLSISASVLAMNIQDWSPLGWIAWIFLQSKGLSRVFSNTTVQKHQFFGTQVSLWFNSPYGEHALCHPDFIDAKPIKGKIRQNRYLTTLQKLSLQFCQNENSDQAYRIIHMSST